MSFDHYKGLRRQAELHQKLFSYVRQEACAPANDWQAYDPPPFELAREIVRDNTKLIKEPETGLWYHADDSGSLSSATLGHTQRYFQVFWPSGRFLAQKLADASCAHFIDDKCVLSIGPGSGLAEIHLVKKRKPELMACIDDDVFARAAIELNAVANDICPGDVLVTLDHPDAMQSVTDGAKNYRLYDTVLAADCLYGRNGARDREVRRLVATLQDLNRKGSDIFIAERDYAELLQRKSLSRGYDEKIAWDKKICKEIGLTEKTLFAEADMSVDNKALGRIMLEARFSHEPVKMYHWSAQKASAPLPPVTMRWWRQPELMPA